MRIEEIYSGAGAYVLLRGDEWAFAHDVIPDAWVRTSGSGLTVFLRPWARLPAGALWVPTVRAIGWPWRYQAEGPNPRDVLPRDENGDQLALAGPVRCEATRARHEFQLLRGQAAIEAAQASVRVNSFARLLLEGSYPFATSAFDARIAITAVDKWEVLEHEDRVLLVARYRERVLVAGDDWVAAAGSLDDAIKALDEADEEYAAAAGDY
jgi:hypothetical protein